MVAFWPGVPPRPGQLAKLQIVTCAEVLGVTAFAAAYALQVFCCSCSGGVTLWGWHTTLWIVLM